MRRFMWNAFIVIAVAIPSFANAVDFSTSITQLDGKPFVDEKGHVTEVTLRKIAVDALLASYPDEPNLPGQEKIKRFTLAIKISDASKPSLDLQVEEVELIKRLVGKGYPVLVVGQVWKLLDPASVPK